MATVKTDLATSLLALDDLPAACDIEQALDHMRAHHLSQLWVCGALHIDCSADALARARRAGWDIRISPPRGGGIPDPEQPAAHDEPDPADVYEDECDAESQWDAEEAEFRELYHPKTRDKRSGGDGR